ncbi:MAG: N-acetyl-gamma-glutamyl-phosphate reductase [Candidatus Hodarchaeota archaeon]
MVRVGIIGATGYVGGELLRILKIHPSVEKIHAFSRTEEGKPVSMIHKNLKNLFDEPFEKYSPNNIVDSIDLLFTAVPHGTAMEIVPEILEMGIKVIDMSADYRLPPEKFEKWYGIKHKPLPSKFTPVYGLPEMYRKEIKKTQIVAVPGCYATGAILATLPLVRNHAVHTQKIVITAMSGTSGAGSKPSEFLHHPEVYNNAKPYSVMSHRHIPEIENVLSDASKENVKIGFVPVLVPMVRGILTVVNVFPLKEKEGNSFLEMYQDNYGQEPFIRLIIEEEKMVDGSMKRKVGGFPYTANVIGTNFCDISLKNDERTNQIAVISAIDNLIKGAAGQAIQCMNIMLKIKEKEGLNKLVGAHPW